MQKIIFQLSEKTKQFKTKQNEKQKQKQKQNMNNYWYNFSKP